MFKHIMVPLDGSRFASRALTNAIDMAGRYGADILLVRVIHQATPMATPPAGGMSVDNPGDAGTAVEAATEEDKEHLSHAKRYMAGKARDVRSHDIQATCMITFGKPARTIMDLAEEHNIDLIVLTTHGRTGLKRVFLGSVADEIIRKSGIPVLVVRAMSKAG